MIIPMFNDMLNVSGGIEAVLVDGQWIEFAERRTPELTRNGNIIFPHQHRPVTVRPDRISAYK
jgi:hypothetical protein